MALVVAVGLIGVVVFFSGRGKQAAAPGVELWNSEVAWAAYWGDGAETTEESEGLVTDLRNIVLELVEFDTLPFGTCLEALNRQLREQHGVDEIEFVFRDESIAREIVSMRLAHVPLMEVLRHCCPRSCRMDMGPGRRVSFGPLHLPSEPVSEGWFRPNKGLLKAGGSGPADVKGQLESVGISFHSGSVAVYYPEAGLLWASGEFDQLELIEAYCAMEPPTLWERLVRWHVWESPWSRWVKPRDPFAP